MFTLLRTSEFKAWVSTLRDDTASALIAARLVRLAAGAWGDTRSVGDGVTELRVHCGPGYRVYVKQRGRAVVVLLCGGDKSSQARDIKRAKALAKDV